MCEKSSLTRQEKIIKKNGYKDLFPIKKIVRIQDYSQNQGDINFVDEKDHHAMKFQCTGPKDTR